jgi:sortase A
VRRIGQLFILAGLAVLLWVVWEIWGTNFITHRAQSHLRDQFRDRVAAAPAAATAPTTAGQPPPPLAEQPDARLVPPQGDAVARMLIPKIDLDVIVVEGVDPGSLKKGPGHYPGTPLPGDDGNVVVSGHRTTYGAPFHDLDGLATGDSIVVDTDRGEFAYKVTSILVVAPDDDGVLDPVPGRHTLTLTTCNPKFSASERLIVQAEQDGGARALGAV